MDINELIEIGEKASKSCLVRSAHVGDYYSGQEYVDWLNLAVRFLDQNFPDDVDNQRFRELALRANGNGNDVYYELIGILKAFEQFPPIPPKTDVMHLITDICMNFNKFDINIRRRYGDRETIKINDEHDLQNAMYSILKLFINDIRPEDYVPSYAGGNSRVDFLLPEFNIIIETKMTNKNLHDKEVGEQLIVDFERYKQVQRGNHLICFVYDKDAYIQNPIGLITDLERLSDEKMRISVFVSPQ